MLIAGVLLGVLSAFCLSLSYLISKQSLHEQASVRRLSAAAFVLMGIVCLIILAVLWPEDAPGFRELAGPTALATGGFAIGMTLLFSALQKAESSRITPLLGFKVAAVAVMMLIFLRRPISYGQWVAVALSTVAAFLLNHIGGRMAMRPLLCVLGTVFAYAASELGVLRLVNIMAGVGGHGSVLAACLMYGTCGVFGGVAMFFYGWPRRAEWKYAVPYSMAYLVAIFAYFASVAYVGLMLAVIIQATRGIMSILLGILLAKLGMEHLERGLGWRIWAQRAAAAILMIAAIALFAYSKP